MPEPLPALNLIAQPGQRRATLEIAREIEQRGFAGISVSSQFSNMAQCLGLAFATERIPFATAIAPIYAQTAEEFAHQAAYVHEVSGGRFQFGIGVAHAPSHIRMGVTPGKPLADIRQDQVIRGHRCPAPDHSRDVAETDDRARGGNRRRTGVRHRIRTCICDDETEARAVLRRTVSNYALMPYYRNYWKEAGYIAEMTGVEAAVAEGRLDDVPKYLPDRWLADITLFGSATKVRDGVEAWRAAGIKTPILVPLSADGDQKTALRQVFAAFSD